MPPTGTGRDRIRVVIVDDAQPLRALLRSTLSRDGRFDVVGEAGDGREGVQVVLSNTPDVVLLDLAMPVMDGLEVIPRIIAGSPGTRIVVLSGFEARQVEEEVIELGAAAYLPKGVRPGELTDTLSRLCRDAPVCAANGRMPVVTQSAACVTTPHHLAADAPDPCLHLVDVTEDLTRDMTERRNSVDTLERMNRELEQRTKQLVRSNTELEQLASVLSHDLNEPLRVVGGFARLLAEDCADHLDDTGRAYVHHITQGVFRMRALIDDLISYARVGADTTTSEPVDCGAVMRAVADALSLTVANTGAELTVGELPVVGGPGGDLFQLFSNLVGNALRFVAAGVRPLVAVDAHAEGDGWHFTVRDNGIGIDPDRRERVFRMFQRLHPSDAYDGTGIGLAICRKVVQGRGGRIWIEGAPQGGSVVHFTLPALAG